MKDQTPILMTGSPGNPSFSQAQMLTNLLFYKMDPFTAGYMPRMYGFMADTTILIEDRIQPEVIANLRKLGSDLLVTEPWDSHTGSFQTCFRN
jgi:gamma-glutamyltranspeptidase